MCNNKFDTVFLCPGFFVSGAPMDICCKRFSRRRSARWRRAGPELGGVCACWSSTRLCRSASGCRRGCKSDLYKCAELWNRLSLSVKLGWILISMIDRLFIAEIWSWWQTSVLTDIMKRKKAPGCNKDDATGSSHTGKAENPEEDPAKVLAHLSFLLLQSFEVCVFVQTLCLLFVFHLSSTIATYFQSSATWEAFLTPEKYNDRDHDTGSGSWWWWPCCICPDSWHAGQRSAPSWSLSQDAAPDQAHIVTIHCHNCHNFISLLMLEVSYKLYRDW